MSRGRPRHDDILTPREWEVAALLREGLTNQEIAERLNISFAAAKYHVGEIISKLAVTSRQDAVRELEGHKRGWGILPLPLMSWLSERLSLPLKASFVPAQAAAASSALAVVLVLLAVALTPWSKGEDRAIETAASEVGLDLASPERQALMDARMQSPFRGTILFTKSEPVDVGNEAPLLAGLVRVTTLSELELALTPDVNLLVIDQSAISDLRSSDLLRGEVKQGRSLMGLNVTLADLHLVSDKNIDPATVLWERSPDGVMTYKTASDLPSLDVLYPAPPAGVTFFSFLTGATERELAEVASRAGTQPPYRTGDDVQLAFLGNTFAATLQRLDAGEWDVAHYVMPKPSICPAGQVVDGRWMSCP